MKGISITRTSVHCEASWHGYYQAITDRKRDSAETVPFATMNNAFVTFACIGRAAGHYVEFKRSQELFIAPSFDRELHVPVLVALAFERLVESGTDADEAIKIAASSEGFVPIVEGWAQGGIEIFKEEHEKSGLLPAEFLANYIGSATKKLL